MDETEPGSDDGATASKPRKSPGPVMLGTGDVVGRYEVANLLGVGGMGVVHAAYDPKLDRKVALKLLRPRGGPNRRARGRARLLREAQALAQLNHPNVVTVHDVGEHDEQVFIAMEFVEGVTLKAWLEDGQRPWRRILDVMIAAGRGVVAAHAKNMVHRDFKPENVMLTGEGSRVLVMDFGLVTAPEVDEMSEYERSLELSFSNDAITRTGSALGTPAYMAPEQFTGRAGPASDQFGFCVTLFEALYGERPFRGSTVQALARSIVQGDVMPAPARDEVPRWLRDVLVRGLSAKPRDRWPTMQALLDALESEPRSKRWVVVGGAAAAVVAGGVFGSQHLQERQRHEACERRAAAMGEVWNETQRGRIEDAFTASALPYAADAWKRAAPKLDEAAQLWAEIRTETCLAEPTTPATLRDARNACLETRLGRMENVVEMLKPADGDAVQSATGLADIDVSSCRDDERLRGMPAPLYSPAARAARQDMQQELHYANALRKMGRLEESNAAAAAVVARARRLEDDRMLARALKSLGMAQTLQTRYHQAGSSLEDAYFVAMEASERELAALAAVDLVAVHGDYLADFDTARRWARHCQKLLDDVGDTIDQANLDLALGRVELAAGNLERAQTLALRAARVFTEEYGANAERTIDARILLVAVHDRQGRIDEALALSRSVLASRIEGYGVEHPHTLKARNNLAAALLGARRLPEAERQLRIALEAMPPDSLDTADATNNLSLVMLLRGDIEEAGKLNAEVIALRRAMLSDDHPHVADALLNAASIELQLGRFDACLKRTLEARLIYAANTDEESLPMLNTYRLEGSVHAYAGRAEAAVAAFERAKQLQESVAPDHPMRHQLAVNLSLSLLELGDSRRALLVTSPYFDGSTSFGEDEDTRLAIVMNHASALLDLGRAKKALELVDDANARAETLDVSSVSVATAEAVALQARWALASRRDKPQLRARVQTYVDGLARDDLENAPIVRRFEAWLEETS